MGVDLEIIYIKMLRENINNKLSFIRTWVIGPSAK